LKGLSIIIVSGNVAGELFKQCVSSLNQTKGDIQSEIIAIEAGISDDFNHSLEINRALKIAKYDTALLVDDDVVFLPDWYSVHEKIFRENPDVGIIGATLHNKKMRIIHTGALISPQHFGYEIPEPVTGIVDREYVTSAFMFISRKVFNNISFDENLKKYAMDSDYCFTARKAGFRVVCSGDIKAIHNIQDTKKKLKNLNSALEADRKYLFEKWQYPYINNENYINITQRGVIYPTFSCNINCEFCYYKFKHERKQRPFNDDVKKELDTGKNFYKLQYIDISGGEPTVYKELVPMVEYCRDIDIRPTIITNGQRPEKIEDLINAGLEDALISYHDIGEHYNTVTNTKKGYSKLTDTIEAFQKNNFSFRTNTILTKLNMERLPAIAQDLAENIKTRIANFIAFNPHGGTGWSDLDDPNIPFQEQYSVIAPYLKEAINILMQNNIFANVRYFPLCCLSGYEKHICNFHQWQWDPYEWNLRSGLYLKKRYWNQKIHLYLLFSSIKARNSTEKKYLYLTKKSSCGGNIFLPTCKQCACYHICDGIYPQYFKRYGGDEFKPIVMDEKIHDPLYFRREDLRWNRLKS
jgi:MoaA/NifB/PqqE/SkfB family radical SAM enzyme